MTHLDLAASHLTQAMTYFRSYRKEAIDQLMIQLAPLIVISQKIAREDREKIHE